MNIISFYKNNKSVKSSDKGGRGEEEEGSALDMGHNFCNPSS